MLNLTIGLKPDQPLTVLCLGAHCDDVEIGCGGTLLTLLEQHSNVNLHWHIFTSTPSRKEEALKGAHLIGAKAANLEVEVLDFKDGFLPYEGAPVKAAMEDIKRKCSPDIVFTHYRHDLHQDHRKISELTWNTFRNHLVLEYEIPKWDGDIATPDTYVPIAADIAQKKIEILQAVYNSQADKKWFTDDLFHSLMRIRGMESNSPSLLAEGFYGRKTVISFSAQ